MCSRIFLHLFVSTSYFELFYNKLLLFLSKMLKNLQSYKGFDFLILIRNSLISSNFYIKDEFHSCVLKFRKGHESGQCHSLQQPLVEFLQGRRSTSTGRKPDYLNVPGLLVHLFKNQYDAFRFLKYSFLKDSRHRISYIY